MQRFLALPLLALAVGHAAAQGFARPDPSVAAKPAAAVVYESAFAGYRPFVDPDTLPWRDVNDEMHRLGGHVGHVPSSAPSRRAPDSAAAPKPPAHAGHGGHK